MLKITYKLLLDRDARGVNELAGGGVNGAICRGGAGRRSFAFLR